MQHEILLHQYTYTTIMKKKAIVFERYYLTFFTLLHLHHCGLCLVNFATQEDSLFRRKSTWGLLWTWWIVDLDSPQPSWNTPIKSLSLRVQWSPDIWVKPNCLVWDKRFIILYAGANSCPSHPHRPFNGWTDQGSDKLYSSSVFLVFDYTCRTCWSCFSCSCFNETQNKS